MWLNSRSRSNGHARTRLGRSLTGCDGTRSILITILPLLTHSGVGEVTGLLLPDAAAFTSSRPPVGKWALSHWAADGGTRRSILRKDCFSAPILWAPAPHPCAGKRQATRRELLQPRGVFRLTSGWPTIRPYPTNRMKTGLLTEVSLRT